MALHTAIYRAIAPVHPIAVRDILAFLAFGAMLLAFAALLVGGVFLVCFGPVWLGLLCFAALIVWCWAAGRGDDGKSFGV